MPFENATVLLRHENVFHVKNSLGSWDSQETRRMIFPTDDAFLAQLIVSREPICIPDVKDEPGFKGYGQMKGIHSWLGVPLIRQGREVMGLLSLASSEIDVYSQEHARIATTFAGQAAVAIENASLFGKARKLAVTDVLTGAHNRRYLYAYGQRELERSQRSGHDLSVIMVDVDRFKAVNDEFGHQVGDQVLVELAALCQGQLRNYDIFARLGGEEFTIILPETGQAAAAQVAERIRTRVEGLRLESDKGPVAVTVSLGLVSISGEKMVLETMINRADEAMYMAKNSGRNCLKIYNSAQIPE